MATQNVTFTTSTTESAEKNSSVKWSNTINRAGTLTLATKGKYVDRDIAITVPTGAVSNVIDQANLTAMLDGNQIQPVVAKVTTSGSLFENNILVQEKPATSTTAFVTGGLELKAMPEKEEDGSLVGSVSATATVTNAGFVAKNATFKTPSKTLSFTLDSLGIGTGVTKYLPTHKLSNAITLAQAYDEAHKAENANTVAEYISYSNHLSSSSNSGDPTDTSVYDVINITVNIPAGYYEADTFTYTIENLLPNFSEELSDAEIVVNDMLLTGYVAYDEKGRKVIGTMPNIGAIKESDITAASNSTSITSAKATIGDDSTNGIPITASSTIKAQANSHTGYYLDGNAKKDLTSSNTKYLTALTIDSGKKISVANNGTISTLSGSGNITSLTMTGTIGTLSAAKITTLSTTKEITTLSGTGKIGTISGEKTVDNLNANMTIGAQAANTTLTLGNGNADDTTHKAKGTVSINGVTVFNNGEWSYAEFDGQLKYPAGTQTVPNQLDVYATTGGYIADNASTMYQITVYNGSATWTD